MAARHEEGRLEGAGGVEIYWQAWLPEGDPRALVLIAHGAAEHSGRYRWTAEQLVARGHAVYALDHRGHGRSQGPRSYVDRMENVVADVDQVAELARSRHPGAPLFLLGHSMGGCISLEYALVHQDKLTGLALSAPLAVLEANPIARVASRALSRIAPRLPVYKIDGTTVSRDPEVVRTYDSDPLNHRGMLPARTIGELERATSGFPARLPSLRLPIVIAYGTGDRLVDPAGSRLVQERSASQDCTLIPYDGLYHEVLNEPEREQVLAAYADWIEARLPAPVAG